MKVYQEKQEIVNTGIEITNYEILQEKAKDGLLKLSMSLGIEVMRMMFEEDVTMYAGPKGKHGTLDSRRLITRLVDPLLDRSKVVSVSLEAHQLGVSGQDFQNIR